MAAFEDGILNKLVNYCFAIYNCTLFYLSLFPVAKLVDNKRRHNYGETLSQAQQEQLLMNTIKQDFLMKKEMKAFQEANKTWKSPYQR